MTTISAKVIADSVNPEGVRLTTLHCHYPLVIHAEVLTHRVFSRNARSSRAVPVKRMIQDCLDDPFIPLHWGAAQAGMQAFEECDNGVIGYGPYGVDGYRISRETAWLQARDEAVMFAQRFAESGYHKQIANRLLAPFLHIDTLITATDWDNFFALRDHADAEPHIAVLARAVRDAIATSKVLELDKTEWHLPYADSDADHQAVCLWLSDHRGGGSYDDVMRHLGLVSAARCARVSYQPFSGSGSIAQDLDLAIKLKNSRHWSPFEHIARPDVLVDNRALYPQYRSAELSGNFRSGWCQFRRILEQEK